MSATTDQTDRQLLERITVDPKVMAGKPVVRGTRLTVDFILGLLAHGASADEILDDYEALEPEDLRACILFASRFLASTAFAPIQLQSA